MPERLLTSRLPESDGSIFVRYSRDAERHQALNLAQGFPDFEPDARLTDALLQVAAVPHCHQYAPAEGVKALRDAVSAMFEDLYQLDVDPDQEITITVGATEAIFTTAQAVLRPGDEALFLCPGFECYEASIRLAGATPVRVDLCHDTYLPDWAAVGERLSRRTRLVVINTPHNPTGVCWPAQDLQTLAVLAEKHGFLVLSDEVYHNSAFAPQGHLCARSIPGLAGRVIVVGSIGKTLLATGWRLGYAIAPAAITRELRKLHQFITFSAPTPLQHAAAALLAAPGSYRAVSTIIRSKRDRFLAGLSDSRFSWEPSQGGYFQLLNYSAISDDGDVCFADYLVREHRIAGIPLSGFGGGSGRSRSLRFCVAKKDETLDRATSILRGV